MKTFAERLHWAMAEKGMKQQPLADAIGTSQVSIHKMLSGQTLETTLVFAIADVLGVSPRWLHTGKGSPHSKDWITIHKIPLLDWTYIDQYLKACLNDDPFDVILSKIPHTLVDYMGITPSKHLFALAVVGNAMQSKDSHPDCLYEGDRVYVDLEEKPTSNVTVLAKIKNDYLLRQLVKDGTKLLLKPLNPDPDYKTIVINDISAIKGVVKAIWREKAER